MKTNLKDLLNDDLKHTIFDSIKLSFDNSHDELVYRYTKFIKDVLLKSCHEKNIKVFEQFIDIIPYLYSLGYRHKKTKIILNEIISILNSLFLVHLRKEMIRDYENDINKYLELFYLKISDLFYFILKNNDHNTFFQFISFYDELFKLFSINVNAIHYKFINNLERHESIFRYVNYHRRLKFAVFSWLIYLRENEQLDNNQLNLYISHLEFNSVDNFTLLSDIIFYNSNIDGILNWSRWDYKDRKNLEFYSNPDPYEWLNLGIVLYNLKYSRLKFVSNEDILNENVFEYLPKKIDSAIDKIYKRTDIWLQALWGSIDNSPGKLFIDEILDRLKATIYMYNKYYQLQIDRSNIDSKVSSSKINRYKNIIKSGFFERNVIFDVFKDSEIVDSEDWDKTNTHSDKILLPNTKQFFLSNFNRDFLGLENMGRNFGQNLFTKFYNTINKENIVIINVNAMLESIEEKIEKGIELNTIILSHNQIYNESGIMNNKDFVPVFNIDENLINTSFIGKYKDIEVYSTSPKEFENFALVLDKNNSISTILKKETDIFRIDITPISEEDAIEKLEREFEYPYIDDKNVEYSKDEFFEKIRLTMIFNIEINLGFKVINRDAYFIYKVV